MRQGAGFNLCNTVINFAACLHVRAAETAPELSRASKSSGISLCRHSAARGPASGGVGAGLGVVGLTAAALGAEVVLTDLPSVLPGLHRNIEVQFDLM